MTNNTPIEEKASHLRQQIFDYVMGKLAEQKVRSIGASGACLYRGKNNTKCAVGHLISDEKLIAKNEGNACTSMSIHIWECVSKQFDTDISLRDFEYHIGTFLLHLQDVHDLSKTLEQLKSNIYGLKNRWRINVQDAIDKFDMWG